MAASLFETSKSISGLLSDLLLYCNKVKKDGRLLVFIDEIQYSRAAVQKLRYFHEERPDVYVIAAGSLLERLLASGISFLVGRVEYLAMHPCSFLEFLNAMREELLYERIKSHPTSLNAFIICSYGRTRSASLQIPTRICPGPGLLRVGLHRKVINFSRISKILYSKN